LCLSGDKNRNEEEKRKEERKAKRRNKKEESGVRITEESGSDYIELGYYFTKA
jgi:hypothetical protein